MGFALGVAGLVSAWSWLIPLYCLPPGGEGVGYALAFAGGAIVVFSTPLHSWIGRLAVACGLFLFCGTVYGVLARAEGAGSISFPILTWIASAALRAGRIQSSFQGDLLLLDNYQGAFAFSPTLGMVGAGPFVLLACCGVVATSLYRYRSVWQLLLLAVLSVLLLALRFAFKAAVFSAQEGVLAEREHSPLTVFFEPWTTMGTAFLLAYFWGTTLEHRGSGTCSLQWAGLVLATLGGLLSGLIIDWRPGGTSKLGRVVIDERLSDDWEPAGRLLTKSRFGDFSTYSFASLTEHLARYFAVSINHTEEYDADFLRNCDVLILKTPKKPLSPDEVVAIQEWIRSGGGLFAVGDHTDLAGMSTYLNEVIGTFGLWFNFDSVAPSGGGGATWWQEAIRPEHPLTAGLSNFSTLTACSIDTSREAEPVMILRRVNATAGDYSRNSNFGTLTALPDCLQGTMVIAAASNAGRGRVLAFGDSTCLSSFCYYRDQHDQFVLRGVTWLNRQTAGARLPKWLGVLIATLVAIGAGVLRRDGRILAIPLFCAGLTGGAVLGTRVQAFFLRPPTPHGLPHAVALLAHGGEVALPPVLGGFEKTERGINLSTFVQLPQRYGFGTKLIEPREDQLEGVELLFVLNPVEGVVEARWLEAVRYWVARGGLLIITVRDVHAGHAHDGSAGYLEGLTLTPIENLRSEVRMAHTPVGEGHVVLVKGSEWLDVDGLAHCMAIPNVDQRARWEDLYYMMEHVAGVTVEDRRTYVP